MLIHKTCGKKLIIDISGGFRLLSPNYSILDSSIGFGMVEIRPSGKKANGVFFCQTCSETLESKEELSTEVLEKCCICGGFKEAGDLKVIPSGGFICSSCCKKDYRTNIVPPTPEEKLLLLIKSQIKDIEERPTLLTLLVKFTK